MRAMILAAGLGKRLGQLTASLPKPLLPVAGRYLIEYTIEALVRAGITEIVINVSYRGGDIKAALGDGERYGAHFSYSEEATPLETGGGIYQALPLLGDEPFLVMSADIITDYPLAGLPKKPMGLAHLVLVNNPSFHGEGDFGLLGPWVDFQALPRMTYANIGIYRPQLFAGCQPGVYPLIDVLRHAIVERQVSGEHYPGLWHNIGTEGQYREVAKQLEGLVH